MRKISQSNNYNTEILSFFNANKNRTEQLSFKKLQYDFGIEIASKIPLYYDLRKAVLSVFLGHHLLDRDSPSPWTKNRKLGKEMGKVSKLYLLQFLVNNSLSCKW